MTVPYKVCYGFMDFVSQGAMHYCSLTGQLLEERLRASHKFPVTDKKGKHGLYSQSRHTEQHLQEEQQCSIQLCNLKQRSILGFTK